MAGLSLYEVAILTALGIGFIALIMYAALHARSKEEDQP